MENYINPYDKEYTRLAILKHEETFKQQVHELHRLYRIQKLLMRNIENESPKVQQNQELRNSNNNINFAETKLDLERPAESRTVNLIDESEIELTLGPSNYSRRRKNSKKTDTPLTSDSGPSFSSSSAGSSHNRDTSNGHNQLDLFQVPDMTNLSNYDQNGNNNHNVERLNQPAWIFQVLSLNMT